MEMQYKTYHVSCMVYSCLPIVLPKLKVMGVFFFSVIVGLIEGEIISDAEIMKAALRVIVNCVCGPVERVSIMYFWSLCLVSESEEAKCKEQTPPPFSVSVFLCLLSLHLSLPLFPFSSLPTQACASHI